MVSNTWLSAVNTKIIAVTKIHLIHVLSLRSGINTAALSQEMKSLRIDFRVLNLSAIRVLFTFLATQSFLKELSDVIPTKTVFRAQPLW